MKKRSNSQSAFFNLRVFIGLFLAVAGIFWVALNEFAKANTSGLGFAASSANLSGRATIDQFGNANASFSGKYKYVGTVPKACGLLVGSGLTCGWPGNTWSAQLASNTVQYTFALSQPAPNDFALFETHDPWGDR